MKKLILFLGFFSACLFASAQTYGLRGGLNFSKSVTGIHVGGFANLGESEKFSNQFEISFSQFGQIETDDPRVPKKQNYLKIGSAFKFYPLKNFNFHAGPELGLLLNAGNSSVPSLDFGVIMGAEAFFTTNTGIGIRYYAGLHNFGDDDNKEFNQALQLSLIYLFNGKQLETWGH